MSVIQSTTSYINSLEGQLRKEMRLCPQCRMEISNPFNAHCPRCYAVVPTQEPGCGSCMHRMSCPVIPSSSTKPS